MKELDDLANDIAGFILKRETELRSRRGLTDQDRELIERGFIKLREMRYTFDIVSRRNREEPFNDPRCGKDYKPGTRYVPPKAKKEEAKRVKDYEVKTDEGRVLANELWEGL